MLVIFERIFSYRCILLSCVFSIEIFLFQASIELNSQVFNCVEYRGRIIILCNLLNNILFSFAYFQLKVTLYRYSNLFCLVANSKFKISNVNLNSSYESYFRLILKRNILKEKENDSFFFFFKEKNRKLVWVLSLSLRQSIPEIKSDVWYCECLCI